MGILSLAALVPAILAPCKFGLYGSRHETYIFRSAYVLYLNCFIAVMQAYQKPSVLRGLAPTQSEALFVAAQLAVLPLCASLAIAAAKVHRLPARA